MTMRPDPTFHASPKLAMEAPPENFAYTLLLSPDFSKPDALAVIDVKPGSPAFSQIVHTTRATSSTISVGTPVRRHCRRSPATRSSRGAT
jgi:selenium binding protein SBP56